MPSVSRLATVDSPPLSATARSTSLSSACSRSRKRSWCTTRPPATAASATRGRAVPRPDVPPPEDRALFTPSGLPDDGRALDPRTRSPAPSPGPAPPAHGAREVAARLIEQRGCDLGECRGLGRVADAQALRALAV